MWSTFARIAASPDPSENRVESAGRITFCPGEERPVGHESEGPSVIDLSKTRNHKVFRVSQRGRTLIVTPQGDTASFSPTDVKVERERTLALVANGGSEESDTPNLLVDLGDANYLGSEMIGFVNRMVTTVRDRGGEHAVVNVSDDMLEGISIMHLDTLWNVRDEEEALDELANESFLQVVRRNGKTIGVTLSATVLVAVAFSVWSLLPPDHNVEHYTAIASLWNEYQERRQSSAEFSGWRKDRLTRIAEIEDELTRTADSSNAAQQHMLFAVRDYLPGIFDPNLRHPDDDAVKLFVTEMKRARRLIQTQYGVSLPLLHADRPSETSPEDGGDAAKPKRKSSEKGQAPSGGRRPDGRKPETAESEEEEDESE